MEWSKDLVRYRLARAHETLEDARILARAGRWNACVNRLYYVCFYGVSALLVRDGLSSSKHTGVRSLFNRHYVKTGKIPKDLARIYNDLFERMQGGTNHPSNLVLACNICNGDEKLDQRWQDFIAQQVLDHARRKERLDRIEAWISQEGGAITMSEQTQGIIREAHSRIVKFWTLK
jgi:uncharacterized protein (UPF0332 family)